MQKISPNPARYFVKFQEIIFSEILLPTSKHFTYCRKMFKMSLRYFSEIHTLFFNNGSNFEKFYFAYKNFYGESKVKISLFSEFFFFLVLYFRFLIHRKTRRVKYQWNNIFYRKKWYSFRIRARLRVRIVCMDDKYKK